MPLFELFSHLNFMQFSNLNSGILSCNKCYVGAGGMHKLSRFEANSAVKKGAILNSGVRVSKIAPISQQYSSSGPPATLLSTTPSNPTGPREDPLDTKKWELFGTGGIAALHDTAESTAALAVHHSLGLFDAVIVTGTNCAKSTIVYTYILTEFHFNVENINFALFALRRCIL